MKELMRSRTDRMIAGVCGGIGEYLGIDSNVIRLIWAIVSVFTVGTGVLAYLIAWLIIPEQAPSAMDAGPAGATTTSSTPTDTGTVIQIEPDQNRRAGLAVGIHAGVRKGRQNKNAAGAGRQCSAASHLDAWSTTFPRT